MLLQHMSQICCQQSLLTVCSLLLLFTSMGAATSLYSATCFTHGNGNTYPANLSAVVGLSGWPPCSKTLQSKIGHDEAARRAASLPILLCHDKGDDVVPYKFGENLLEHRVQTDLRT